MIEQRATARAAAQLESQLADKLAAEKIAEANLPDDPSSDELRVALEKVQQA